MQLFIAGRLMQGSYYPRACMKARKSLKSIRNQDAVQKASQTPEEVKQRIAEAAASGATALYLSNFDLTEVPEEIRQLAFFGKIMARLEQDYESSGLAGKTAPAQICVIGRKPANKLTRSSQRKNRLGGLPPSSPISTYACDWIEYPTGQTRFFGKDARR
jgi:hypothetical protein